MTNLELLELAQRIQIHYFENGIQCDVKTGNESPFITVGNEQPYEFYCTEKEVTDHAKEIGVLNLGYRKPINNQKQSQLIQLICVIYQSEYYKSILNGEKPNIEYINEIKKVTGKSHVQILNIAENSNLPDTCIQTLRG